MIKKKSKITKKARVKKIKKKVRKYSSHVNPPESPSKSPPIILFFGGIWGIKILN
jgi:hypothetical protein